jgi:tripartite-type tricarboxylate transporter receptor subunit TctC
MSTLERCQCLIAALACLTLLDGALQPASAQSYPSRPVRIIVPVPAGAGPDVEARQVAAVLGRELGQPFIVENRPGAAQLLGIEAVARAPADGYVLGMGQGGNLAANPRLYDRPPFDVEREIVGISLLLKNPWLLYVNSKVPARTLGEFVALAKSRPDSFTYASTGVGSFLHLSGEWFQSLTGTRLKHVPYGASPWQNDLVAGQVDAVFYPLVTLVDHVKAGKLRALAISNDGRRAAQLPDVPTFAQAGLPAFSAIAWNGLIAPAGTPHEIVQTLASAAARATRSEEFQQFAHRIGAVPIGSSPAEFDAFMRAERALFRRIIADAGIRLE